MLSCGRADPGAHSMGQEWRAGWVSPPPFVQFWLCVAGQGGGGCRQIRLTVPPCPRGGLRDLRVL